MDPKATDAGSTHVPGSGVTKLRREVFWKIIPRTTTGMHISAVAGKYWNVGTHGCTSCNASAEASASRDGAC